MKCPYCGWEAEKEICPHCKAAIPHEETKETEPEPIRVSKKKLRSDENGT